MYNIHVYDNKNTKSQAPQYVKKCIAEILAGVSLGPVRQDILILWFERPRIFGLGFQLLFCLLCVAYIL
jgi:hypothetical protein